MLKFYDTTNWSCDDCGAWKFDARIVMIEAKDDAVALCHYCASKLAGMIREHLGEEVATDA